jgi:hypothetical protein
MKSKDTKEPPPPRKPPPTPTPPWQFTDWATL